MSRLKESGARDLIETFSMLAFAMIVLVVACVTGAFDCKQCEIYEANQTQINLTTESESQ